MSTTELRSTEDFVISPRSFKDIFRHHPAGVAVVTLTAADGTPVGFTATSVISVSAQPPVLAFSITKVSSAWPALSVAESALVHFLSYEQAELSVRFATPDIDRFAGTEVVTLPTGEPRIAAVEAWARVRVDERVEVGSSYLVVGTVTELADDDGATEVTPSRLVYVDRTYHRIDRASRVE